MTEPRPKPRSFGWFVGVATLATIAIGALLAGPAWLWKGEAGLVGMAVALGACWIGSVAGRAAQHGIFAAIKSPEGSVHAILGALGVRMFTTLAVVLVVIALEPFDLFPFAIWLLVGYMALLCLEVFVAMREFGQNHPPSRSGENSSAEAESGSQDGEA